MEEKEILSALNDVYDIKFNKLKLLRKGGCCSYCVYSEGNKYFMKIISRAYMGTAKQSLDILMYLEERGVSVPHVILTKEGFPYVEIFEPGDTICMVLFNYIAGREPMEGEDIELIGELTGKMHNVMSGYKGQLLEHGKDFFIDRYINILQQKNYDQNKIDIFREYGDFLWKRVEKLPRGYCHGDLHRGNILRTSSAQYYALDFDTSCYAFPMYDIMIMCNSTNYFDFQEEGYSKSKLTYEAFLKGYTKYCTLSNEELVVFYDFIAIYHYQLQATIIEVNGLDCVDNNFLDGQLNWLLSWREQCEREK